MSATSIETPEESRFTEAERNLLAAQQQDPPVPLYKFVFTGGPCGGKTTALARVFSFLRERNFEVINVPEAWGGLNSNGLSLDFFSTPGMAPIAQGAVMDVQMAMEEASKKVLQARGKPAVLLCDRGMMDGSVYVSAKEFQKVLDERNTTVVEIRDNRYDACFHMVTAADGAEAYYTLENNKVRTESKEDAIEVDRLTQKAWVGHPHLYVLDNSTDFEGKMSRLVDIISKIVGLPSNLKRRSAKFLLRSKPDYTKFPNDFQVFDVEKVYLRKLHPETTYSFIRRRTSVDPTTNKTLGSVYQITNVKRVPESGEVVEQKRIINKRDYDDGYQIRDRKRHIVQQRRISFLYEKQSFTIHIYLAPVSDVYILHAQVQAKNGPEPEVELPPFLDVERILHDTPEDEANYGAYSLSLIQE